MSMEEILRIMENMILDSQTDNKGEKATEKNKETKTKLQAGTDSVTEAGVSGEE